MPLGWVWTDDRLTEGERELSARNYLLVLTLAMAVNVLACWIFSLLVRAIAVTNWLSLLIVCLVCTVLLVLGMTVGRLDELAPALRAMICVSLGSSGLVSLLVCWLTPLSIDGMYFSTGGVCIAAGLTTCVYYYDESPEWWRKYSRNFGWYVMALTTLFSLFDLPNLLAVINGMVAAVYSGWVVRTLAMGMSLRLSYSNVAVTVMSVYRDLIVYLWTILFGNRGP